MKIDIEMIMKMMMEKRMDIQSLKNHNERLYKVVNEK